MGRKLPPVDAELYKRCDEVLHFLWDPVGVSGHPSSRDEYYGYIPAIFELVKNDAAAEDIVHALNNLESDQMGLRPNKDNACNVANILLEWRAWIYESFAQGIVEER